MRFLKGIAIAGLSILTSTTALPAQTGADTIVVFDGSGSMWGQIEGRTKIEIARETLASVLSELDAAQTIGMIAYGHRQKGVCSDIEDIVPLGAANDTVPQMIDAANGIQPRGKTPITDAVRRAAEALKYTENAATVVLLTDGIETCDADPCALGAQLEQLGVGFTAHVVGFGLTEEEGREVQCLADTTGGLYFSAQSADELGNALRETVQAQTLVPSEDDFVDALPATRRVIFRFRDTPEGDQIGARELTGGVEQGDGTPVAQDAFKFAFPEANGFSATANLEPGSYVGRFQREDGASGGYDVVYTFDVPEGEGEHVIEASFAGTLNVNLYINPTLPFQAGDPFPRATSGSGPRINLEVFAVKDGVVSAEPVAKGRTGIQSFPLGVGTYLVRGVLDRTTAAEAIVEVVAGRDTDMDFSFDATRVYVDARDADGAPVERQTTYWYDKVPSGRNYWVSGRGVRDGQVQPFYLPTGDWVVNVGGEGKGKRRSQAVISVPGDFADLRVEIGESLVLDEDDLAYLESPAYSGCAEMVKVVHTGCLVRAEEQSSSVLTPEEPRQADVEATPQVDTQATDAEASTEDEVAPQAVEPEAQSTSDLEGLTGEAIVFEADGSEHRFHIVYDPSALTEATFVLDEGWCGSEGCGATRLMFPYDEVAPLRSDEDRTWTMFSDEGYLFQFRKTGDESVVFISGAGGRDVPFTLSEVITLAGETAQVDVAAPAQGTTRQGPLVGVFSLHDDAPVETLVSDVAPLVACQSEPVVFYPDGTVEWKAFQSIGADPIYSTQTTGQCDVQDGLQSCAGEVPSLFAGFTATPLEDAHFRLCAEADGACQVAVACFYPGSDIQAATPLPNGGNLADALLTRQDEKPAGFRYDALNALQVE